MQMFQPSTPLAPTWAQNAHTLLPALALLVVGLGGLMIATLVPTGAGGQYAVVAPPWYTLARTIALAQKAGGAVSDAGGPANIIIVHGRGAGFEQALYAAGAWAVIDPMHLRGCAGFAPADEGMR